MAVAQHKIWRRQVLAVGLMLIIGAVGILGGMALYHIIFTSVDYRTEATKQALKEIHRNPDRAPEVLDDLREIYDGIGDTTTAASYFLADSPPAGADPAWTGFLCYLHDEGDERATRRLETMRVETGDGEQALLAWLKDNAEDEDELFAAWEQVQDEVKFEKDDAGRYIDASTAVSN